MNGLKYDVIVSQLNTCFPAPVQFTLLLLRLGLCGIVGMRPQELLVVV